LLIICISIRLFSSQYHLLKQLVVKKLFFRRIFCRNYRTMNLKIGVICILLFFLPFNFFSLRPFRTNIFRAFRTKFSDKFSLRPCSLIRVTRLGENWANLRPLGDCLLWAVFMKIAEVAQIVRLLFSAVKFMYYIVWTKKGRATFRAIFHIHGVDVMITILCEKLLFSQNLCFDKIFCII
jgi:hypothetical protein